MATATKIEWCTHTWSPWIGCTRLSAACDHCYAADMAHRYGWAAFETGAPRHRTSASYWKQPLAWNRKAEAAGQRETVFASLCDPFDAEVDPAWRADHMGLIEATPWLEWLLLTKRAKLARQFFAGRKVPDNVRMGITTEDRKMLDLRAPDVVVIKARLLPFVSAEPLLERLSFRWGKWHPWTKGGTTDHLDSLRRFGWVIAGGESGPKARPSHPDWFRSLRDECAEAGVPFFFKQWGEYGPLSKIEQAAGVKAAHVFGDGVQMGRFGKKDAGALLDGKLHREFPR